MATLVLFLHLTAALFWVGGQLFLALILAPVLRKTLTPKDRMPLSLAIAQRFKRFGHGALGILILTGFWQVRYIFFSSTVSFFETDYGRIFGLKMGFLVLTLVLGVLHDKRWGPALVRTSHTPDSLDFKTATRRIIFWARFNIAATLAVVACAAALRLTTF
ncbi:MAG: CopD family protein [Elusimicrobia bacterium]|jgi:putative copper resistance protein D|nr:CopD family protein [Elusimicrobiota bacterium]